MRFRNSFLRAFMACPLQAKFHYLDRLPERQGSKAAFGTVIHAALQQYNLTGDEDEAIEVFKRLWSSPEEAGVDIEVWNKYTTFGGLRQRGIEIVREYHAKQRWEQRQVVAVEHHFLVPFGRHELEGTIDLLELKKNHRSKELLRIVDFKTNAKAPNYAELALNTQFCADAETEILTRRGWMRYDRLIEGEDVLTLDQERDMAEWQPAQGVHVFPVEDQLLVSMEGQGHSSLTTANHRWPVEHTISSRKGWRRERRVVLSEDLGGDDRVPCSAPVANLPAEPKWADAFVELVAWFWTEGHWTRFAAALAQSEAVNPTGTRRIRECLTALYGPQKSSLRQGHAHAVAPAWREIAGPDCVRFYLNKAAAAEVRLALDADKVLRAEFLTSLTEEQLWLLIDISIEADGTVHHGSRVITQRSKGRLDAFQMACSLAGVRTSLTRRDVGGQGRYAGREQWRLALLERRRHFVPATRHKGFTKTLVPYTGVVWCPQTDNETWLARRNGFVFFTGNTTYIWATLQPEFWLGNGPDFPPVRNGEWWMEMTEGAPRRGIWYQLWGNKEMDAGGREDVDFQRLQRACDEVERAIEMGVFVPDISGETCALCDFANGPCPVEIPSRAELEDHRLNEEETSWV